MTHSVATGQQGVSPAGVSWRWQQPVQAIAWGVMLMSIAGLITGPNQGVAIPGMIVPIFVLILTTVTHTSGRNKLYGANPKVRREAKYGAQVYGIVEDIETVHAGEDNHLSLAKLGLLVQSAHGRYRSNTIARVDNLRGIALGAVVALNEHPSEPDVIVPSVEEGGIRPAQGATLTPAMPGEVLPQYTGGPTTLAGALMPAGLRSLLNLVFFAAGLGLGWVLVYSGLFYLANGPAPNF